MNNTENPKQLPWDFYFALTAENLFISYRIRINSIKIKQPCQRALLLVRFEVLICN